MSKHVLAAAAVAALIGSGAMAQTTTPSTSGAAPMTTQDKMPAPNAKLPRDKFVSQESTNEWRVSKLIGMSVKGPDGNTIGDINDVVLDDQGMTHSVVIGVGGFLGVGEKNVAVPFGSLQISRNAAGDKIEKVSANYTKEQLKDAPTFKWESERHTAIKPKG